MIAHSRGTRRWRNRMDEEGSRPVIAKFTTSAETPSCLYCKRKLVRSERLHHLWLCTHCDQLFAVTKDGK